MKFRIDIHNKEFYYNMFYGSNRYGFKDLSVYHFVGLGDAFESEYSRKRYFYHSLKNIVNKFALRSSLIRWEDYSTREIKVVMLPSNLVSDGLVPGSVTLHFCTQVEDYIAQDIYKNSVLYWIKGAGDLEPCGFVFYEYGIIILFHDQELTFFYQSNYRSMVGKFDLFPVVYDEGHYCPKWIYFGNIGNSGSNACLDTRFVIETEIRSDLYKENIFLVAEQYNWSNNPLFYSRGGDVYATDSQVVEVVAGGEERGGFRTLEHRNVPIWKGAWFDKQLQKQGIFSLSRPAFLNHSKRTTIKLSYDY